MKKLHIIIYTPIIFIITFFNLSCFDMYSGVLENADPGKYALGIIEASSTNGLRYLNVNGKGEIYDSGWSAAYTDANQVCVSDFNNDNAPDLLIINQSTYNPVIWYNSKQGSFQNSYALPVLLVGFNAVTGDFDNDGDNDIAVASKSTTFTYFSNDGTGIFTYAQDLSTGDDLRSITSGDYDRDKKLDVVIGESNTGSIKLLKNQYILTASYASNATTIYSYGSGQVPVLKSFDMDNDGDIDIFSVSSNGYYCVLINNGDGTFVPGGEVSISNQQNCTVADFNGDGYTDVYVTTASGLYDKLLLNNGNNTFSEKDVSVTLSDSGTAVSAGDIDLDGNVDIILSADTGTYILLNDGNGNFRKAASYPSFSGVASNAAGVFTN